MEKQKKTKQQLKDELYQLIFGEGGLVDSKEEEMRVFKDSHGKRRIVIVARKTTWLDEEKE